MSQSEKTPTNPRTGGQERADARLNRARILAAARDVVSRLGPEASIARVASAAGVGIGTVYRKYPTKAALFSAVLRQSRDELFARVASAGGAADAPAALAELIRAAARLVRRDRALAEALGQRFGSDLGCEEVQNQLCRVTVDLVRRGQQCGRFRTDIRPEAYGALLRGIGAASVSRELEGMDDEAAAQCLADTLIRALLPGP